MTATGVESTFPRLLLRHARERGGKPAIREKDLGIWQSWTWSEVRDEVEWLACGLAQAGLKRGQHLAVIGANRPRLYWALSAAQALGAVPVPFYEDAPSGEMTYVFQNAQIAFAIVEDQEQADKLFEILPQCPDLKRIWYDEARGLRHYDQPELASYESLREKGREFAKANPGFFEAEIAKGHGSDPAIMLYTSGTTGSPKGVVLSHDNLIASSRAYAELEGLRDDDEVLAYLPMAWVGQNVFSFAQPMVVGFRINCPESAETVLTDMREIGPTYYFAPPRVLEALLTQVTIRMEDAGWVKRRMFRYFMGLARRVGARILDGSSVGPGERLLYALGGLLVYGPLRNALGMSRVRVAYTAGEAIGPDLFVFYRSLGVNLKQLYGSTETSVMVCVQPNGAVKPDTVGPPMKGVEVRIAVNGEILLKCPGLFVEYYKNPEATREVKDAEGWYHTGDAGYFDAGGQLKIIDRAKDVGKLTDGTLFAPKYLENKLKFFPYIKEAVAFGDGKAEATAMINIDMQAVGDWAERRGLPYAGYTDLAAKPQVTELVRECVEKVNADLAADPTLSGSQVHRFVILHKELDADDGELTRTRKVRRGFIGEKYAVIVEALYSGAGRCNVEAQVRFEDGRTGTVRAELHVQDAKVFAPEAGEARRMNLHDAEPQTVGRKLGEVVLRLDGVSLAFGGVKALTDVSFDVREHEVRAIIGPNGAGKSSMLNVINGVYQPQAGTITYRGETRTGMEPHHAARSGIARTFQSLALFKGMSVLDNILAGRTLMMKSNILLQALRIGPALKEEVAHRRQVEDIIDFLEIQHVRKTPVGRLPYGLQKRVDLGRALAMEPKVLLLDEPMAGMNVEEKQDMCRFILDVNDEFGTTIVLIEHDMGVVMDLSDRVVVLDYGRKIADGTPDEVRSSQAVIDAYLGVKH